MELSGMTGDFSVSSLADDMSRVQQRIQQIQSRFNMEMMLPEQSFQHVLKHQMQDSSPIKEQQNAFSTRKAASQNDGVERVRREKGAIGEMLLSSAQKYGVDPKLLSAVAEVESGYNADAVSSAGAIGVMQLMPDTAASLGVKNPYDPKQNIDGGAKYLRELLDDFGGNVRKAVAAYNAGPAAVRKYHGVPPYAETQNYVSHVLDLSK